MPIAQARRRRQRRQSLLALLVEENVQSRIRRIPSSGGAPSFEQSPHALRAHDVASRASQAAVGVVRGLVADLDHGEGHEDQAGRGSRQRAGQHVGAAAQLRKRAGGSMMALLPSRGVVGSAHRTPEGIQTAEV